MLYTLKYFKLEKYVINLIFSWCIYKLKKYNYIVLFYIVLNLHNEYTSCLKAKISIIRFFIYMFFKDYLRYE